MNRHLYFYFSEYGFGAVSLPSCFVSESVVVMGRRPAITHSIDENDRVVDGIYVV